MDERVLAVQRMQDYIAAHWDGEITPAALSRASLYSPWYSYRLFREHTGLSPADYIRRFRLAKSALLLRDGHSSVTEAAFMAGFGSVDGYQRAFTRAFGKNPGEYARHPVPVFLFTPYGVKFRHIERRTEMETVRSVFVQVVEKPARKCYIRRGVKADDYMSYCEEVGCDVWGLLTSIRSLIGEPVCLWLPPQYRAAGTSEYVQGVELAPDDALPVPDGFDVIRLPAAKYLQFQGEPFKEEDYCEAIDALKTAIDRYQPSLIGYAWDDDNPRIQLEPVGARGYIELLPIKPVK